MTAPTTLTVWLDRSARGTAKPWKLTVKTDGFAQVHTLDRATDHSHSLAAVLVQANGYLDVPADWTTTSESSATTTV